MALKKSRLADEPSEAVLRSNGHQQRRLAPSRSRPAAGRSRPLETAGHAVAGGVAEGQRAAGTSRTSHGSLAAAAASRPVCANRDKHGRGRIPDQIEREERVHDLTELALEKQANRIVSERQTRSRPLLEGFHAWRENEAPRGLPKSASRAAMDDTLANWTALCRYTESGWLDIDNNAAENALRGICLGRRNWLYCGSDRGGRIRGDGGKTVASPSFPQSNARSVHRAHGRAEPQAPRQPAACHSRKTGRSSLAVCGQPGLPADAAARRPDLLYLRRRRAEAASEEGLRCTVACTRAHPGRCARSRRGQSP